MDRRQFYRIIWEIIMKIIFIEQVADRKGKTPEKVFGCSYSLYPTPNLAVLYNAAVLDQAGHNVSIFELKNDDYLSIPKADLYIIDSVILSKDQDLILSEVLKNRNVCFFGPAPTLNPEDYLKYSKHFVLRGETEHVISKAVKDHKDCLGVSYREGNKIFHNKTAGIIKDLDTIPFPLIKIDNKSYYNPKLKMHKFTNILSSRGCANRCYFCVPNSMSWARELEWKKFNSGKPPVTIRSAKNIIEEVRKLKDEGYEELSFIDDQFVVGKKRIIEICEGIKDLNLEYGILARADRINDEDVVKSLAVSGCKYVDIGAESLNQDVLDDIRKDVRVNTIIESIELLAKYGIEPKINIMFGTSPKETKEIVNDTIKKTLALPSPYCMFSIATPFPGTEFRERAKKNNWIIKDDDTNPAANAQISYPHLTNRELESITKKANLRFYLRRKTILNQISKIKNAKSALYSAKMLFNLIKNLRG